MKGSSTLSGLLLCLAASGHAQAQIYKCTSPQGAVSYASVPCEPNRGVTSLQRAGPPPMASAGEPADLAHQTNLKAIEYLTTPGRHAVAPAKNLPPAARALSECEGVVYRGQCIDASGPPPAVEQIMRQVVKTP